MKGYLFILAAFLLYLDTDLNAQIDLELQLNASVDAAETNQLFFYRIQLFNEGDSQVSGIHVKDEIPSEFEFESYSSTQGEYNSDSGIWSAGAIVEEQTAELKVYFRCNSSGLDFEFSAEVVEMDQSDIDSTPNNSDGSESEDDESSDTISILEEQFCFSFHPDLLPLLDLYNSTNGQEWYDNTGWSSGAIGASCNPCTDHWTGIECSGGRVTNITFNGNNNITGSIPLSIGQISELERLLITKNSLTGNLPSDIGDLSKLRLLWLNDNELEGNLPPELFNLPEIQQISLQDNQFSGSVPPTYGNIWCNTQVHLESNKLSGCFPPEAANYTGSILNPFSGNVDLAWGGNISRFKNEGGTIESQINAYCGNEDELNSINSNCECVPAEEVICDNPEIPALIEFYNSLNGENWTAKIGWEYGEASLDCDPCFWTGIGCNENGEVTEISLARNNLQGQIPSSISQLINLNFLNLEENSISGFDPTIFSSLDKIRTLKLAWNQIEQEIPQEFIYLNQLEVLNLYHNKMFGEIPEFLFENSNLKKLYLYSNNFTGPIPLSLFEATQELIVSLSDNNLVTCLESINWNPCDSDSLSLYTYPNPLMPWYGDLNHLCDSGGTMNSIEAWCDDGDDSNGGDVILPDCTCGPGEPIDCTHPDLAPLLDFYHAMNGDDWQFTGGWKQGASGLNCDVCDWYGIVCNEAGRVQVLDFSENFTPNSNLIGSIPSSISELSYLEFIAIIDSEVGPLPQSITQLDSLKYLIIYNSKLHGEIPPGLGNMMSLGVVNLTRNNLSGCIPEDFIALCDAPLIQIQDNPLLPWEGNLAHICQSDGTMESQIGAYCRKEDGTYSFINENCNCGELVGLEEIENPNNSNSITIFPNPTEEQITIDGIEASIKRAGIYNIQGELVSNFDEKTNTPDKSSIEFNLSAFPNGIYFLRIIDENGRNYSGKIIKE